MLFFSWFFDFFESLFYSLPARRRGTYESDTGLSDQIEISFYQTENLAERRGGAPERMMAKQLAYTLDEAGFDYKIEYGYDRLFDPPTENAIDVLGWWIDNSPEDSQHCNMLLTDKRGGGASFPNGKNQTHGQNRTKRLAEAKSRCNTSQCRNIWGGIHEFCHGQGGHHNTPMMEEKPSMLLHDNMIEIMEEKFK